MSTVARWKVNTYFLFCCLIIKNKDIEEDGTTYHVLLSKTYESEKELVAPKKGKIRVSGFKQFVAVVDTPNGTYFISLINIYFI